jgi:putative NADPH-quinone reductase
VLRAKIAYQFPDGDGGAGVSVGMLRAKVAIVLNTSNTPEGREKEAFGGPLEALLKRCTFPFCRVAKVDRRMFSVVVTSSEAERCRWLDEVRSLVARRFGVAKVSAKTPN